ncbi:DNA repair protein SWI5 homolog [Amia ocellicauda]|uniref:DNA repair protein SWI5 homolog n=1 Tax=Amia ocellicauda TaxID=2972642 RepID=UPI003463CBE3
MDSEEKATLDCQDADWTSTPGKARGCLARGLGRRTPLAASKKLNSRFKSPLQTSNTSQSPAALQSSVEKEVEDLKKRQGELDLEITQLQTEGLCVEELDQHISLLHEYNDIKDTGQMLLGRLAAIRGVTTKDVYRDFSMDLED